MSDAPLTIPAAWRGAELSARSDWLHELTDADRAEMDAALASVRDVPLEHVTRTSFVLPRLASRLFEIREELERGSGATLLRGLRMEDYSVDEAQRLFLGLMQHVGTPVSQSASGELVFSVRDAGFSTDDPRARGPNTRKNLSFHTDRCDVIAFLCLQPARSGGENLIVSSVSLYNEILARRPDLLEVLKQPFLYKRHNVDMGNDQPFCRQPVFSFCEGHFACAFLRVLIERAYAKDGAPEMTPEQREALDYLETVAAEERLQMRLLQQPGDVLLLNNWVTLHRRTAFEDWPEPEQRRHILRIWLTVSNSRPLDPVFRDNYGAVAAGAIRGGMRARPRAD